MSSWDRQAALKKYQSLFAASTDAEALMEELGTPTKLAIELAASYVPSRSPSALAEALTKCPVALEDMLRDPRILAADLSQPELSAPAGDALQPETWVFEPAPETPPLFAPETRSEAESAVSPRRRVLVGALVAYLIPAIVIGLPVAVALVCLGLPFLCGGGALIYGAVREALAVFGRLRLVSDMLLTGGMALIGCSVGLFLCWFGLWLSMELCWLWVGKALTGLGKRLCVREEAA